MEMRSAALQIDQEESAISPANLARLKRAAQAIETADAVIIGAGAGMSVDSGLPDYRGTLGFWKAYPPFRGRTYAEIASPQLMREDPEQAWGFYGHCLDIYRTTSPHQGFQIIRNMLNKSERDYFIFTSNIDGHFGRDFNAEKILEVHGSIHFLQCSRGLACSPAIWSAKDCFVEVDPVSFRATSALPKCQHCSAIARPNILMFGDDAWVPMRTVEQENAYSEWLSQNRTKNIVAIELGAGPTIPTVRVECQKRANTLIRVNPRDFLGPANAISIPLKALEAIIGIEAFLS
jgi:NAD-dependent SIR2 family protein deacetylase